MSPVRILHCLLTATLVTMLSAQGWGAPKETTTLNLYIWEDYIDPDIITSFENKTSVRVNVLTFDDDDQREETLLATQGKGFDIICISDSYMANPAELGWMAELDLQRMPNLRHVEYPFSEWIPEARRYAVPYFWGTHGIAYRSDLMETPPTSWRDLFTLAPQYAGKLVQTSTMRLLVGIALLAQGRDYNSENPEDLQAASRVLLEQVPYLFGYQTSDLSEQNPLVTGDAVMAPMFNGDVLTLQALNPHIKYIHPDEGAHVWTDFLVVSSGSRHQALAFQFLDYLNQPDIALANSRYVNYATPNLAAKALADEDYRNNPIIYPSPETLQRAHLLKPLSTSAQHQQAAIFVRTISHFESTLERQ